MIAGREPAEGSAGAGAASAEEAGGRRSWVLPAEPDAVPRARRLVRDTVAATDGAVLANDAQLVAAELLANAVQHGRPPVVLTLHAGPGRVRIEVADTNPRPPVRSMVNTQDMTGRGLSLVERIGARWGVTPNPAGGKTVWAELSDQPEDPPSEPDVDAVLASWEDVGGRDEVYTVVIGDVPTDLLVAAKAHTDNVIRELTLAASHAAGAATDMLPRRLDRLIGALVDGFADARESIKRQALAAASRGEPRTVLSLTLPASMAEAGEAYLSALDEIDSYARAARLLTLETPPQHRAFRRWYVESLAYQLRHLSTGATPAPPPTFEERLLQELDTLGKAQRVSEQAVRLQAVTTALVRARTLEEVAEVVVREGVHALGASGGGLLVLTSDGQSLRLPGAVGYDAALVEQLRSEPADAPLPAATALRIGEPVWLENVEQRDERFPALTGVEPGTVSMCALPLVVVGQRLGALRFSFPTRRLFDNEERAFIMALADACAQTLHRVQATTAAERAAARLTFLADASAELASSLNYRETLARVARLAVPTLADWCSIDMLDDAGGLHRLATEHVDPEKVALARRLREQYPPDMSSPIGAPYVVRTGQTQLISDVTDDVLRTVAGDPDRLRLARELQLRSALVVPLEARDRVLGALTLVYAESDRRYDEADVHLAEDLARRAAAAIDNAQLFGEAREVAARLQRALLPEAVPTVPGWDVAAHYGPAGRETQVGGDWFDVVPVDRDMVAVIGDVMGRGVAAAAAMAQMRSAVRAYATVDPRPQSILSKLDLMMATLDVEQLVTVAVLKVDCATGDIDVGCAGHFPPVRVPRSGPAEQVLSPVSTPLGIDASERSVTKLRLRRGETLILYTDGLVERRDEDIDVGIERLLAAAAAARELPLGAQVAQVLDDVQVESNTMDDVTVLALRRH